MHLDECPRRASDDIRDGSGIHYCNKRLSNQPCSKTHLEGNCDCPELTTYGNLLSVAAKQNRKLLQKFLAQIRRIPKGKVATYGDVAYAAGYPGYARQVAWALHGSGTTVPWQRVVGSGGKILLTGEHGFEQRMRLQSEGVRLNGLRVDMKAHHHSFFAKRTPAKGALKKRATKR